MEYMVWKMRFAHFPHHILHLWRGEAAASTRGERAKLLRTWHALKTAPSMRGGPQCLPLVEGALFIVTFLLFSGLNTTEEKKRYWCVYKNFASLAYKNLVDAQCSRGSEQHGQKLD